MTDESDAPEVSQKFSCKYCKSDIERGAIKCPRCRSFLGRLGWLRNATTELSILSIVIAVFALSLPAIKLLLPQKSELTVTVLKSEGKTFEFMVSNKGNRPAVIIQGELEFPSTYKGDHLVNWVRLEEHDFRQIIIEPEKTYRFASDTMSGIAPLQPNPGLSVDISSVIQAIPENCSLKLVYVDFNGSENVISKPYRCFAG